jgi:DNA-binding CsgD family transcriptional regulator
MLLAPPESNEKRSQESVVGLSATGILSGFQVRVLELIASGMTDEAMAQSLGVSVHRVRYAVRDLIIRLSAHNRAEAVFIATTRMVIWPR